MTPSPRQVGRALDVLLRLPPDLLQVLVERAMDHLDAMEAVGADLEPDDDGEVDPDDEAPPNAEGPWWTPTTGPDRCRPVSLARAA